MAWYPKAIKRPIPEANSQPDIRPRGVCLHTAVSNSSSLFGFWTSPSSDGVESHFYLRKDGTAEQYVGTETRADCQVDGNPYCISVEAWDGAGVVWTRDADIPGWNTAQVNWLVDFFVWAHRMHGIPLRTMKFMGDSGIGYHRQFIGPRPSFATKPRECPGDRKVAQIPGIIALAVKKAAAVAPKPPVEDDMTDAQYNSLNKKLDEVKGYAESAYNSLNGAVQTFERRDVERDAALDAAVQRVEDVAKATLNRVDTAVNTLVEAIQGMNRPTPTSDVRDGLEGLGEGLPSDPK